MTDENEVKNSNKFGFSLSLAFGLKCFRSAKRKFFSLLLLTRIFVTTFNPLWEFLGRLRFGKTQINLVFLSAWPLAKMLSLGKEKIFLFALAYSHFCHYLCRRNDARMVESVDTRDLKSLAQ